MAKKWSEIKFKAKHQPTCDNCGQARPCVKFIPGESNYTGMDTDQCHVCRGHLDCEECDGDAYRFS